MLQMGILVAKPAFICLLLTLYQSNSKGIKHKSIKQRGQRKRGKKVLEDKVRKPHTLNGGKRS